MPTLKFVLWQFIFLSLFSLRAFLPGDKNSEELVQSFEDELMSKSSVYRFFYGSEHCSERQQDVQSGVGFAGVSQPCIYKNTSYYDFFFPPLFVLFEPSCGTSQMGTWRRCPVVAGVVESEADQGDTGQMDGATGGVAPPWSSLGTQSPIWRVR